MKTCGRCGAENPDDRSACLTCFAPLEEGARGTLELRAGVGRGFRLPLKGLFYLLLVVAAAGLIYFFLGGGSPTTAARRYLELVQMDKKEAAGQLVAGGGEGNLLGLKGLRIDEFDTPGVSWTGAGAEVEVRLTLAVNVSSSTLTPDRASMFVNLFKALKEPVTFNMVMTREGRRWKVDEAASNSQFRKALDRALTAELKQELQIVSKPPPKLPGPATSAPAPASPTLGPVAPPGAPVAPLAPIPAPATPGTGGAGASSGEEFM